MPSNDPEYQADYIRQHYKDNKEYYKSKAKEAAKRKREWYHYLKAGTQCVKCGENHPACLEYHHRNPQEKEFTISENVNRFGKARLLHEIAKCDILCANCHRKQHY